MDKPKSKKGTMAIAVRPEDSVKPPPTKRELLEATAMALCEDNAKRREEATKVAKKAVEARDDAIHAWVLCRAKDGKLDANYYHPSHVRMDVSLNFHVPMEGPLKVLADAAYEACLAIPRPLNYVDALKNLQRAQATAKSDRVSDILAAPGVAEALAKAGKRILGIAEAAQPSVTV